MLERKVTIQNKLGMHLRAAAVFIETAHKFRSDVYLRKDGKEVNAKSIMGLMTLGAAYGTTITVVTHGADEQDAQDKLVAIIEAKFGEKE